MFSHIMLGANDIEVSKKFYDATLGELGCQPGFVDDRGRCFYFHEGSIFGLSVPINGEEATHGNGSTIGFNVASPEQGDAWHTVGLANGGTNCEDPPGIRTFEGTGDIYLAYLRDPSGNKICAFKKLP